MNLNPYVITLLALLSLTGALTTPAQADTEVDVALVLAVDISISMDPEEQELQRQGFVEAFRSPQVHNAISGGTLGRVSVTYMEWAGSTVQNFVVPWTEISDPEEALSFANRLARLQSGAVRARPSPGPSMPACGCWRRARWTQCGG